MEPFWVIWSPQGGNPIVKHNTQPEAVAEAERLALQHPGREFYVLAAIARTKIKAVEVEWAGQPPVELPKGQTLATACFIVDRLDEELRKRGGIQPSDEVIREWVEICDQAIRSGLGPKAV